MNIFMYTNRFGVYMAGKLYWRIKKDGKWTWRPAKVGGRIKDLSETGKWGVFVQELEVEE